MLDNRHKQTHTVLKRAKGKHTLVEYAKQVSEFSLQCNIHKINQFIFAGLPVDYGALEVSIPLGMTDKYKVKPGDSPAVIKLKKEILEDIRAAQGKMTAKGCTVARPDYFIEWLDPENNLQSVRVEFKKVGKTSTPEQKEYAQKLWEKMLIPTEEIHTPEEYWFILEKYRIPNRGRGLF